MSICAIVFIFSLRKTLINFTDYIHSLVIKHLPTVLIAFNFQYKTLTYKQIQNIHAASFTGEVAWEFLCFSVLFASLICVSLLFFQSSLCCLFFRRHNHRCKPRAATHTTSQHSQIPRRISTPPSDHYTKTFSKIPKVRFLPKIIRINVSCINLCISSF